MRDRITAYFTILLILPTLVWSDIYNPPAEIVKLTDDHYKFITTALEELENGLSSKVALDLTEAERMIGDNNPVYFSYGYKSDPLDEIYTQYNEVSCKQNMEVLPSWECSFSGKALVFNNVELEQTVWVQDKVTLKEAVIIIEFLKTKPSYKCRGKRSDKEPCEAVFDETNLEQIKLISHSYSDKNIYRIGDHRSHPRQIYYIEPAICIKDPCKLTITGTSIVMY